MSMPASSFASFKKSRESSLDKLAKDLAAVQTQKRQKDPRFWEATVDKAKNGSAIIRFLDSPAGESVPFVRIWTHAFKGPGGWYFENSRTTLGSEEHDPVSELNSRLWNEGDRGQAIARAQKRKLSHISNILVVKDPAAPENEGKVFLYKYGKKIFDKINDKMTPTFAGEEPVNPFDFWKGAHFRLRICDDAGYRSYDKSEFAAPAPLFSGDDADAKIEAVWKQCHSLQAFIAPDQFKSYDVLKAKLNRVLTAEAPAPEHHEESHEEDSTTPPATPPNGVPGADRELPGDDNLAFFENLAK